MLKSRELVGLFVGAVSLAVAVGPYWVFYLALLFLSLGIGYEVSRVLGFRDFYIAGVVFLVSSYSLELGFALALLLSLYAGWKSWSMEDFLKAVFLSFYCGYLPTFLLALKGKGGFEVVKLLLFVWAVDVLSYYVGKSWGKTPIAQRLSPKKTWEGFWGGAVGGFFVLALFYGFGKALVYSFFLVPSAFFGDLFKSFVKRQVGVKDFSHLLGEHGGLTDRFDSLLFCAPVFLYLIQHG